MNALKTGSVLYVESKEPFGKIRYLISAAIYLSNTNLIRFLESVVFKFYTPSQPWSK